MIRGTAIVSLVILLVLVLYVPSAHPPQRFLAQIRMEHGAIARSWGADAAEQILQRAVNMQSAAANATPVPKARDAPSNAGVGAAVAREMASVNQRLFNNPYFRSIDALLLLASHRLATMLHWLPMLLVFTLAVLCDGALIRLVKAREFIQHDPEMFAVYACLAIAGACATVIALVVPVTVHPIVLPLAPIALSVLTGQALACFHRRA